MRLFRQKLRKEHLLNGAIYDEGRGPLATRVAYAWKVYNTTKPKYTEAHKSFARAFLITTFDLPDDDVGSELNTEKLTTLMQLQEKTRWLTAKVQPMPHMKFITADPFITEKKYLDFIVAVNQDIMELNASIDRYNAANVVQKLMVLRCIYQQQKKIDAKYPPHAMSHCPCYQRIIHIQLFNELKKQFESLGITSLSQVQDNDPRHIEAAKPSSLTDLISNMSPEKVSKILKILSNGALFSLSDLTQLYKADEPNYTNFQTFLKTHTIQFIGGGNSKNFRVTGPGHSDYVLKVDNRLNMPRHVEAHLRAHTLKSTLTAIAAERQATYVTSQGPTTSTLLITEFCEKGNLCDESARHTAYQNKITSALAIYSQMASVLIKIQHDSAAFPDMKNTNWLLDKEGILRISDTKSFVFARADGMLDYNHHANRWCAGKLSTLFMNPPEFGTAHPISVDKLHAYMLGKNLYQYLTGCKFTALKGRHNGHQYDFSAGLFQTQAGQALKVLIQGLIQYSPLHRLSVNDAHFQLAQLQMQKDPTKKRCLELLTAIQSQRIHERDEPVNRFIREKNKALLYTKDLHEIALIQQELEKTLSKIQHDPVLLKIKTIIQSFRDKASWYTIGMKAKADRIEKALYNVPLDQRDHIFTHTSPAAMAVQKELASHRHLGKRGVVYLNQDGSVNNTKAAASFKQFKQRLHVDVPKKNMATKPSHTTKIIVR